MTENPTPHTPQQILSLPLGAGNLSDAKTVAQYLIRIAQAADPKRPFGNSDPETALIFAFANANLIWLRTDENGIIDAYPQDTFEEILNSLYEFLFQADFSTLTLPPEPKEWFIIQLATHPHIETQMSDFLEEPYTENDAKTKAEDLNNSEYAYRWVPIHIPSKT